MSKNFYNLYIEDDFIKPLLSIFNKTGLSKRREFISFLENNSISEAVTEYYLNKFFRTIGYDDLSFCEKYEERAVEEMSDGLDYLCYNIPNIQGLYIVSEDKSDVKKLLDLLSKADRSLIINSFDEKFDISVYENIFEITPDTYFSVEEKEKGYYADKKNYNTFRFHRFMSQVIAAVFINYLLKATGEIISDYTIYKNK